jgi:hypothetical protein
MPASERGNYPTPKPQMISKALSAIVMTRPGASAKQMAPKKLRISGITAHPDSSSG